MMTNDARVAAVKERVRAKEQQKRLRLAAGILIAAAFLAGALLGVCHKNKMRFGTEKPEYPEAGKGGE